ncbi:argininosuccinate lyase [Pseudonocardia sp. KRD-184]|uniref:Argininosuccinate lyase n=1 Tax=Pseudonocardia oceani TaxID=2792013 RepID=A0ABS6U7Z4_9PSEU|nr:argininosuccinate lyase [Pseudonocardia oceani]MBW0089451.1 argininosuccinate lyase [Pseudonocardia oceani]MBW0096457.1 argininosuccinate lyase [Pseudonocardia oceani]MBW0109151.1 argininosuccinate lyase [Pseudonocardia oceani]MBW0120696.1 argininosuccinate lyase [Pseudonocardia oceani]MBW0128370.1 argininosuccinate lyase [Pseudonocardia oceani]
MTTPQARARRSRPEGFPRSGPAPELIESGFEIENADAAFLHHGLNLADLAHVLDLARRGIVPPDAERTLLALLLDVCDIAPEDFPYDPSFGEPYNSRERYFVSRIGDVAGWLHAGRPRREAARVALRLHLRAALAELVEEAVRASLDLVDRAEEHAATLLPDQTYLQQAQPSTFGHYLLSFVYPTVRDARRLLDELDGIDTSPGGAGCVNGTRLLEDRAPIAAALGFRSVIPHTRDAMWQVDGLVHILATTASLLSNFSKLAEDLEIFSSSEFDFVDLADAYSRSSILMPQKRNPYALAIVRGASGVMIGRLTGFLAVTKSPSARSDNLIFAYGEVPRALELGLRITRLMGGVVRTLRVNPDRMREELDRGYTQATDLAEHLVGLVGVDYRTAYVVVGNTVRAAAQAGVPGSAITGRMLDDAALAHTGRDWGLADADLSDVLDPRSIVASRRAEGGAAPDAVASMVADLRGTLEGIGAAAVERTAGFAAAEEELVARARAGAGAAG